MKWLVLVLLILLIAFSGCTQHEPTTTTSTITIISSTTTTLPTVTTTMPETTSTIATTTTSTTTTIVTTSTTIQETTTTTTMTSTTTTTTSSGIKTVQIDYVSGTSLTIRNTGTGSINEVEITVKINDVVVACDLTPDTFSPGLTASCTLGTACNSGDIIKVYAPAGMVQDIC